MTALEKTKLNYENLNIGWYIFGLCSIFTCSWCYSIVGVITRKINEISFSVMMFHYGWTASVILMIYLTGEHICTGAFFRTPRFMTYSWS